MEKAYALRLPVWAFLACRRALVYALKKHNINFDVDEKVREILHVASENERDYKYSVSRLPIDETELMNKLRNLSFVRELTLHQKRNVLRLVSLPSGATFSVPGAGKTTEALAFYYFKKQSESKLLVVCPKNAFAAWEEQLNLCTLVPPKVVRLVGGEKQIRIYLSSNAEVFLITYQQLPNVRDIVANFMLVHPTFMFLDESHHVKRGADGHWGSTVLSLAHLPVSKLIMTGTPLPNSTSDLVPQFNFIFPEMDADAENVETLIKPIFVRTTKKELALPDVKRLLIPIQLRPRQRNLYELLRSEEARRLAGISSRDRNTLRGIGKSVIRLIQMVSQPALLARDDIDFPEEFYSVLEEGDSPKVEYACYRARQLAKSGQKVIIWSGFVENVETISLRLNDIGADFIHGGVEAGSEAEEDTRERKIKRFHDDKHAFVLVANPAACAEGISLHTVCHHAIYVDRNYNAAQYLQSEDRIHRLGLAPDVMTTVEILHSPDTVDESILRRLKLKIDKMAEVLNDSSIKIDPVLSEDTLDPDLAVIGFGPEDVQDFIAHLNRM